jgi:predicted phosphodiesterase
MRHLRVAALYDIHGNLPALAAVLSEVERAQPDAIVVGGDIAAGPMPRETLERVIALGPRARCLMGNTDRLLVEHYDGTSTAGDGSIWVRRDAWAAARLTGAGRDFLAALPPTVVLDVTGLGPTFFCHGSPRNDEERITSQTPGDSLDAMLAGTAERVVVCGHTHVQFDRAHAGRRIVNAGSVGLHSEEGPGAYWLLLGPGVELRRTTYDLDDAARRIRATGYPEPDGLIERLAGRAATT